MFRIGVAPELLKRNQLLPDSNDDASIKKAANLLAEAINCALSPGVRERALDIAKRISIEARFPVPVLICDKSKFQSVLPDFAYCCGKATQKKEKKKTVSN